MPDKRKNYPNKKRMNHLLLSIMLRELHRFYCCIVSLFILGKKLKISEKANSSLIQIFKRHKAVTCLKSKIKCSKIIRRLTQGIYLVKLYNISVSVN